MLREANQALLESKDDARVLRIMDPVEGDFKLTWDPKDRDSVDLARKSFDDAIKKGMTAYSVTKKGDRDRVVKEFDQDAEALIIAPRMVGG